MKQYTTMIGTAAAWRILFVIAVIAALPLIGIAQDDDDLPEIKLIPKIELSKDEKTLLDSATEPKKYLKAALDRMESRIKSAEQRTAASEFDGMLSDLGAFHALIDVTLEHLEATEVRRGKVLETFKKYEIALRGFAPRIENMRREVPSEYNAYILKLLKRVRDNRARAIEPFFSDTVLPAQKPTKQ